MTISDYNIKFYPVINNAQSFILCLDHAIDKCDANTRMQLEVIGWNEQCKNIITDALNYYYNHVKDVIKLDQRAWWPKEENKDAD